MGQASERLFDEYLVAAARAGDRPAFEQLARRWQGRLVAHAWRLTGDREMARDAAQAGWGEIARGLGRLRDERAFPAWAYRIVSRACAGEIGAAVKRRRIAAELQAAEQPTAAEPVEPSGHGRLQAAIRGLPAGERAAIALHHFEELSVAEVAVALAVPAGTVKTRLMNARRKLRAILEGDDP
ncbi:MAG: RNA polymerase sigma factor [Novosphingobium sp.]